MPKFARAFIIFGAPAFAGLINSFHPRHGGRAGVYQGIGPHVDWWLTLHLLNLAAFSLIALAAYLLLQNATHWAATLGRIALGIYTPLYLAFDTLAGIGTGLLIRHAREIPADRRAALEPAIDLVWAGDFSWSLAVAGSVAWIVAMTATAVAFAQTGRRLVALALGIAAFVITGWGTSGGTHGSAQWWSAVAIFTVIGLVFARPAIPTVGLLLAGLFFGTTHVVPYGPIAMACFLAAAACIESEKGRATATSNNLS
jgi:hypothetical protein